jgi:RimJ/RimL family protein N-acetyltransferase
MEENERSGSSLRFRTTRTTIHSVDASDERAIRFVTDTLNDPRVHETYSDEGREPLTLAEVRDEYSGRDQHMFVAKATGSDEFVGAVEVDRMDRRVGSAVFGLLVVPKYQDRGYGAEILAPVVDWLFETMRMHRVWTLVGANADTSSIVQIPGFEKEGVMRDADYINGEYVDRHVIACLETGWAETKEKLAAYLGHFKPDEAVYPRLPDESDTGGAVKQRPEEATLHQSE